MQLIKEIETEKKFIEFLLEVKILKNANKITESKKKYIMYT